MVRLAQITPMVTVVDMQRSVQFFTETLGFSIGYQVESYVYLKRDSVSIRLILAGEGVNIHRSEFQQSCYIDVEGLDELYQQLQANLDRLPKGRVKKPFNQFYGQREFHVIDEDAFLICFGEPINT